jgi:hypothetical protein
MRIEADLDCFESEALFDILHHEILEHTCLAKLKHLGKEISDSQMKWHTVHAKFLEGIKTKLLAKHYEAANAREKALKARANKKRSPKVSKANSK